MKLVATILFHLLGLACIAADVAIIATLGQQDLSWAGWVAIAFYWIFAVRLEEDIINVCLNHYFKALDSGIKPEEARRILPQAMMTQIWGAFQPNQLDNWFKLRLNPHAQSEIRMVAQAMQELING